MSDNTKIEWCDSTFNPWIGCSEISPACDNCYAREFAARFGMAEWGPGKPRHRTSPANWKKPLQWDRQHAEFFAEHGRRRRVFCASLADVFDNEVPAAWRAELFALIGQTPHLDWLLLTKRIGNVLDMVGIGNWPENAALGFTAVNQEEVERDWPKARACRMALPLLYLFVSIEPMLAPINLLSVNRAGDDWTYCDDVLTGFRASKVGGVYDGRRIDWVIVGFESGTHARPGSPQWVRSLRDQCAAAGTPFMFKQWGEWAPYDRGQTNSALLASPGSLDEPMQRFGKTLSGRLLDGVDHNGFPEAQP